MPIRRCPDQALVGAVKVTTSVPVPGHSDSVIQADRIRAGKHGQCATSALARCSFRAVIARSRSAICGLETAPAQCTTFAAIDHVESGFRRTSATDPTRLVRNTCSSRGVHPIHRCLARKRSRLVHLLCPHCKNPIELVRIDPRQEITCTACGSSFRLDDSSTTGWTAPAGQAETHSPNRIAPTDAPTERLLFLGCKSVGGFTSSFSEDTCTSRARVGWLSTAPPAILAAPVGTSRLPRVRRVLPSDPAR